MGITKASSRLAAGNPHLFYSEEQPSAVSAGCFSDPCRSDGLNDQDPVIRRVSAGILGHLSIPEAEATLIYRLKDSEFTGTRSCLRALAQVK
jgi:hypothetical protein